MKICLECDYKQQKFKSNQLYALWRTKCVNRRWWVVSTELKIYGLRSQMLSIYPYHYPAPMPCSDPSILPPSFIYCSFPNSLLFVFMNIPDFLLKHCVVWYVEVSLYSTDQDESSYFANYQLCSLMASYSSKNVRGKWRDMGRNILKTIKRYLMSSIFT